MIRKKLQHQFRRLGEFGDCQRTEIPAMATTLMMLATTNRPESPRSRRATFRRRGGFSFSLKMGMNDAVNAPSPSRRRNKLGMVKARRMPGDKTHPHERRIDHFPHIPSTRLVKVATPSAPEDFNIFDIAGSLKFKFKVQGSM